MSSTLVWSQTDLVNYSNWPNVLNNAMYILFCEGVSQSVSGWPVAPNLLNLTFNLDYTGTILTIGASVSYTGFTPSTNAQDAYTYYSANTSAVVNAQALYIIYSGLQTTPDTFRKIFFYYLVNGWPSSGTITKPSQFLSSSITALEWVNTNFPNFETFTP